MKLIQKSESHSIGSPTGCKCLIVDDTDMPKTGWNIELIGRIWSHVSNSSKLDCKGLFLGYHDAKSFYGLDFSLHGEKGKNAKKPFGLSPKQTKDRFTKRSSKDSAASTRKAEYFIKKTEILLMMIRRAISKGLSFDYLLVDSWFVSDGLVSFVLGCTKKFHLLGMAKMGKPVIIIMERQ